jgi:hypothetical protein
MTPIGSTEVSRFGYFINGYELFYAENYQPTDEPGQQGS